MKNLKAYLEKLDHPEEAERMCAAVEIGHLNASDAVPALLERLATEPARTVRHAIFRALIRIDADAAIEGSVRLLASDDPEIRNQAIDVLRSKGARSIPFLSAVMRDGDKDLRKFVLDVLNGAQAGEADAIYEAALSDRNLNVVITAVEYLGTTRATRFRSRIEELLLADTHPMLAAACLEALAAIGNELSLGTIRRRFPDLGALPDFLLASCIKAVGALGTSGEFAELAGLLAVRGSHLRPAILDALFAIHQRHPGEALDKDLLSAFQPVVEDGDPPLYRYEAVRALAVLSSRDDVYSFLVSCLASPERLVRLGAIESLRVTGRPGLESVLASRALEETDAEVLEALSA